MGLRNGGLYRQEVVSSGLTVLAIILPNNYVSKRNKLSLKKI